MACGWWVLICVIWCGMWFLFCSFVCVVLGLGFWLGLLFDCLLRLVSTRLRGFGWLCRVSMFSWCLVW